MAGFQALRGGRMAIVAGVTALVLFAGLAIVLPVPARGTAYTLYAATSGWGLQPSSITSPGPTLIVTRGERVDLTLFSADGLTHSWCIDYSGNLACEVANENLSAQFSSSITPTLHTFYPLGAPGVYRYVCGVHGGTIMYGMIQIRAAVNPVVSVSSPTGSQRWTGGSSHSIVWTMTDPDDLVTALRAWVNYTTTSGGPWSPIAGPILGSTNPHSVSWTLPVLNATSASVNVTVQDPAGNRAWAVKPIPVIDSSQPSVIGRTPPNGASGISTATSVIVTFDEAMNRTATAMPATTALQDLSSLAWVPVTYIWGPGDTVLTVHPTSNLAPTTTYRATVNVSAKDASDPGNSLSSMSAWVFTTGTGADLVKPQITNVVATPAVAEYTASVNVTATVTDNDRVLASYVNLTLPDGSRLNRSMAVVSGSTWAWSQTYPLLGLYAFRVEAVDPSGNWNRSGVANFVVRDTTPPVISNLAARPSPAELYGSVNITASVSDPFLSTVYLAVNGTNSSMARNPVTGAWYGLFTPMTIATFPFVVWARDTSNNFASASGTVNSQDTTPPPMPMGLVATPSTGSVELRWSAVSAPDLAGYQLNRSTSTAGPFTLIGPTTIAGTTFVDSSVQPGVTYYYVVKSVDIRGHASLPSNVASAAVPPPALDLIPVIVAGVAIAFVVAALAVALLLRRRRQKGP